MSFETDKLKLEKNFQDVTKNNIEATALKKYTQIQNPENFTKQKRTISLYNNNISTIILLRPSRFIVSLPNFTEYFIPFTKVIFKIVPSDFITLDTNNYYISQQLRYFWVRDAINNTWKLYIDLWLDVEPNNPPNGNPNFHVTIDLFLMNELKWEELNFNKR